VEDLASGLIKRFKGLADRIVILCVGDDRVVTDLLGPLVGTGLKCAGVNAYVYGSLDYFINGSNLKQTITHLQKKHFGAKVLVIDSAESDEINYIGIKDGKINFFSKPDLFVGDSAILAYNMKRENGKIKLNQVGYSQIEQQAKIITNSVVKFLNYCYEQY